MHIWKKKNIFVFVGLFFLIGTISLTFLCVNNQKNNTKLDKVILKTNNVVDKSMFAIMVSPEEGADYEEADTFPVDGFLNMDLSGCIDGVGNVINGVIEYNPATKSLKLKTKGTSYCYLYFDLNRLCQENTPIGECVRSAETKGFNSNVEGGLYRYQGIAGNVDNYVCFGTTDKETCLNNPDTYMYRIIGVNSNNQVKLIKETILDKELSWSSYPVKDTTWPDSDLFFELNDSLFLNNTEYITSMWKDAISTITWKYGVFERNVSASQLYNVENSWTNTVNSKISLMYAHDVLYAIQSGGLICYADGALGEEQYHDDCDLSWILTGHTLKEWTMSAGPHIGSNAGSLTPNIYGIVMLTNTTDKNGTLYSEHIGNKGAVRPVFYLKNSTPYASGEGTASNPFMLNIDDKNSKDDRVVINNGDMYTNSASVILSIKSTGATEMCISNTSNCNNWEAYKTSKNWTLLNGDGTKTIYAWFKDKNGNISNYVTDTVMLDTVAPSGSIFDLGAYTNSVIVVFRVSSSDASRVCFTNTPNKEDCDRWNQNLYTPLSHTLTSGDGTKTIYAWFKDAAGNISSNYATGTTVLDTTIPTVTAQAIDNNTAGANISWTTSEETTICINTSSSRTNMSNCIGGNFTGYSDRTLTTWGGTITASGTYYVHAKDKAGNIGISSAITLTKLQSFGEYLVANKPTGFNSTTSYGGLYRFIGTSANNYVKLGSVVYRVIGVTSEINSTLGLGKYQVKLIKDTSVTTRAWHSSSSNISFPSSSMYTYLQGSSVLSNTSVIPSGWSSHIDSVKWNVGTAAAWKSASVIYEKESATISSNSFKIGLLYTSDYSWAYTAGGGTDCNGNTCKSWLTPSATEWSMSFRGVSDSIYKAWYISNNGSFYADNITNSKAVRPVFYLDFNVRRTSGTGTSSNPFVITYD